MTDVADLQRQVAQAESEGDADKAEQLQAEIIDNAPDSAEATEARFRLGLAILFRHKNTEQALAFFKAAAAAKDKTAYAHSARVSQALCLWSLNKRQQAIFELRKLLPKDVQPAGHTAMALDFLSLLLRESHAAAADIVKVDTQRKEHLETLAANANNDEEKSHFMNRLAAAHAEGGNKADQALAKAKYQEVVNLGKKAGAEALAAAKTGLRELAGAR
jgi:hypothetical protein